MIKKLGPVLCISARIRKKNWPLDLIWYLSKHDPPVTFFLGPPFRVRFTEYVWNVGNSQNGHRILASIYLFGCSRSLTEKHASRKQNLKFLWIMTIIARMTYAHDIYRRRGCVHHTRNPYVCVLHLLLLSKGRLIKQHCLLFIFIRRTFPLSFYNNMNYEINYTTTAARHDNHSEQQ